MTRLLALLLVLALGGPPSSAPQPVPVATRTPAATPVSRWAVPPVHLSPIPTETRLAGDGVAPDRSTSGTLTGTASWVRASLGPSYLAMRLPKGTHVAVCGPLDCVRRTVNDYGPSRRKHPERIADLSARDFQRVCGPLSQGVCDVTARVLGGIELPETSTEGATP